MKMLNQINHPIYGLTPQGDLISKEKGLYSFSFEVTYPCLYGKTTQDFDTLRNLFDRMLDILDENFIIQKTDFFLEHEFKDERMDDSFIEEMNHAHFLGRKIKIQKSYITFTALPDHYLKYDSKKTNLFLTKEKKKQILQPIIDQKYISKENITIYEEKKQKIKILLSNSELLTARYLKDEEDFEKTWSYWNTLTTTNESSDLIIENGEIKTGNKIFKSFSINDLGQLPDQLNEYTIDSKRSNENMPIPKGLLSPLGTELKGNHILNQFFYLPPQEEYLSELKKKQNRFNNILHFFTPKNGNKISKTSDEEDNQIYADQLEEFRLQLREKHQKIVLTHVNIIAEELEIKDNDFLLKINQNKVDTIDLYFSSCIGNAIGLPTDLYMPLTQEQSYSFFYTENYTLGILEGMRVVCPISGNPIKVDFFRDLKSNNEIQNYNSWAVGQSGSGKSFTMNKILMHQFLVGDHIFNIDGSSSFERATQFINHVSNGKHGFFMKISSDTKIGMNPFTLIEDEKIKSKIEFLSLLLLNILDLKDPKEEKFYDILFKILLKEYYQDKKITTYTFNSFIDFFHEKAGNIIKKNGMTNFLDEKPILFLLNDFYKDGIYDFLLNNENEELKNLSENRYITFQIKELKDSPKLFSIVTFLLTNIYKTKLYSKKLLTRIKFIHYDEVWTANDKPVLMNFIKDTIKTVRSQNGATIFTSQEPEDFFESEIIKNTVINNSELGFITNLEKYKGKADYVRSLLSLTETQKNVIFSLNMQRNKDDQFREFACLVGRKRIGVYGMEVSLEEKAIYESDPKQKGILNELDETCLYNPVLTSKEYANQFRNN